MNKEIGGKPKKLTPILLGISLFILLSSFIAWQPFKQEVTQKIYFPFGIIALYVLSLFSSPKRRLQDWVLPAFLFWSLISLFIHARISDSSVTWRYLNFSLMSEGFIHIFFAVVLFKLIYEHVDKLPVLFFPIGFYLWRAFTIRSLTPLFAIIICSLIYCVAKKKWTIFAWLAAGTAGLVIKIWPYIALKAQARIFAWPYVLKQLTWQGLGFDKNIMCNMILKPVGWGYIHNDFLNVTRDLGAIAAVLIGAFLLRFFKHFKIRFLDLACLFCLIVSFFQTSAYFPCIAIIWISLFALREINVRTRNWNL